MFELSEDLKVVEEDLLGSKIYYIDNFYKNPEKVSDYLFNRRVPMWKMNQTPTYNGVHFNDRRLLKKDKRILKVYNFLSSVCGGRIVHEGFRSAISTNMTRFISNSFNDYVNNFWWPHIDYGYNCIVYFNEDEENSGTNLYHPNVMNTIEWDQKNANSEQYMCWRPKERYYLLKTFKSVYNRCVLFDGKKFPHGMNISNDRFFSDIPLKKRVSWQYHRCNQVFFLY
jgi:hypothetical protein